MEIIKKLWKGDVPLFITFWVFGVIISAIFRVLFYYINQNQIAFILKFGNYSLYFLSGLSLIYSLFIWISIWRSADKYKDSQFLAAVAKLVVILGALHTFIDYDTGIFNNLMKQENHSYLQQLKNEVNNLNQGLPTKLDENTELHKITLEKNNISYYFRMINLNKNQFVYFKNNQSSAKATVNKHIINNACNNNDIKNLLSHNMNIYYHYESEGIEIFNIHLTKNDCYAK